MTEMATVKKEPLKAPKVIPQSHEDEARDGQYQDASDRDYSDLYPDDFHDQLDSELGSEK